MELRDFCWLCTQGSIPGGTWGVIWGVLGIKPGFGYVQGQHPPGCTTASVPRQIFWVKQKLTTICGRYLLHTNNRLEPSPGWHDLGSTFISEEGRHYSVPWEDSHCLIQRLAVDSATSVRPQGLRTGSGSSAERFVTESGPQMGGLIVWVPLRSGGSVYASQRTGLNMSWPVVVTSLGVRGPNSAPTGWWTGTRDRQPCHGFCNSKYQESETTIGVLTIIISNQSTESRTKANIIDKYKRDQNVH